MSLTNSQFKAIMKEYDFRRTLNAGKLRERREEIFDKIPKLQAIDKEIAEFGLKVSKMIFNAPQDREAMMLKLRDKIQELKHQKAELLEKNGYPQDYLDLIYDCTLCEDTGYIGSEKCICLKQAIINASYELSNMKDTLREENFSTFKLDYYSNQPHPVYGVSPLDNVKMVYKRCKAFVADFDHTFTNLILYGQAGLGKTFLCNCVAKEILDTSHTVVYLSAHQLFKLFEEYRFKNDDGEISYEDIEYLFNCDLLIVDDLGSEVINSFTSSELFNLLNTRILKKKSTMISTNLEPSEWKQFYSDRIVSRIFGNYLTIKLFGEDIRIQKVHR